MEVTLLPRIVRAGAAPKYCGMSREVFDAEIRPMVTRVPVGTQGVGFDRLELDRALDDYIARRGQAPAPNRSGQKCKSKSKAPASSGAVGVGTSTNASTVTDFEKALDRATGRKQKGT